MYTRVYCIGFLPGLCIGGIPKDLEIPRRHHHEQKSIKRAVACRKQTSIYLTRISGGWEYIGQFISCLIFDPKKDTPCLVKVGDKVPIYSISKAEYDLPQNEPK